MTAPSDPLAAAPQYLGRGWVPIPIPPLNGKPTKGPRDAGWQTLRLTAEDLPQHFSPNVNIGLLLGTPSHGLVDVDLDCPEALALAPSLLPPTGLVSGRERSPRSHYWYLGDPPDTRTQKFQYGIKDSRGSLTLVELRGTGGQTVVPPSLHPDDEDQYIWHSFGEPARVNAGILLRSVTKVAIGALLARFWPPEGARHDAALPIAGLFLAAGWDENEAAHLVYLAAEAAGHQDPTDRRRVVHDTYRKASDGRPTSGIPTLKGYMPTEVVDTLWRWCCAISPNPPKSRTANGDAPHQTGERPNPWALAKDAPAFLAEEEQEFQGLVKDLVAPGAITLIDSPKGIGKSQFAYALAVALATGGMFRGEQVTPVRVLLLDRENPRPTVKKRLRSWGAATAKNLRVLTRQDAPDLKDRKTWAEFPVEDYDVVIIDSVGASTEGITEKEGKQTSEVLATLLDLAHRDIGIVLLQNTEKTGTNIRGRGEWPDRADIHYEVRDATGFTPSGKRPWWTELPNDGAADWAARAARRKGRTEYRLAFIPAKFRLGPEPEPFCVEMSLPKDELWALWDVTADLIQAGAAAQTQAAQEKEDKQVRAAEALAKLVRERAEAGNPISKTEAEKHLHEKEQLPRDDARAVVKEHMGKLWRKIEGCKGLHPLSQTDPPRKTDPPETPHESRAGEAGVSADLDSSGRKNTPPPNPVLNGLSEDAIFLRAGKSTPAEMDAQKTAPNKACRDPQIFAADEVEKQPDSRDAGGFDWDRGQQRAPQKDSKVF